MLLRSALELIAVVDVIAILAVVSLLASDLRGAVGARRKARSAAACPHASEQT